MAIIKYRIEATVTRTDENADRNVIGCVWQYEEVTDPSRAGRLLTRAEAVEIIKARSLVKVYKDRNGVVWDEPDEPLLQEFGGFYSRRRFS